MSTTIDQRVVEMRFDNKQFEANVKTSMSTLEKLKQSLDLTGASKGLENIGAAAKNINMSGLSSAVENVRLKFSALEVMAVTALTNITNSAINAGKRIVSALAIDPVSQGFAEYELKMNSIQTIMASTGESLETVNKYLNELNEYADKTIYSFSDMTNNIGKFTNAGVSLKDAVAAIQGVSNVAAVSGANANEASRAMYNFAQALSAGYVKLIDWKSIENANMATVEFKNQLLETAVEVGTLKKTADGMYQVLTRNAQGKKMDNVISATRDFNESLAYQWMTTEVLVKTLGKYADETTDIGKKAFAAAQDIKTFSQLFDTLKEAAGSGWAQTWEIIIGDFEEAKKILTELGKVIGGFIDRMSDARNELLRLWKEQGGRDALIEAFRNSFEALGKIIKPISEAFRDIFPPITSEQLVNLTNGLKTFTERLKIGDETADKIKRTFRGLFAVLDLLKDAFGFVLNVAGQVFSLFGGPAAGGILELTARFGDFLVKLRNTAKEGDIFGRTFEKVQEIFTTVADKIKNAFEKVQEIFTTVADKIKDAIDRIASAFKGFKSIDMGPLDEFSDKVEKRFRPFTRLGQIFEAVFEAIVKVLVWAAPIVAKLGSTIGEGIRALADKVSYAIKNMKFNEIFDIINTGLFSTLLFGIKEFINSLTDITSKVDISFGTKGFLKGVTSVLDGVRSSLEAYQNNIKAKTLLTIASAIAILAASLVVLSLIDSEKLSTSLMAITVLFVELALAMKYIQKTLGTGKTAKVSTQMIAMATAILILSIAMKNLSSLDWEGINKGIVGIAGLATVLVVAANSLDKSSGKLIKGSTGLIAFATAILIMSKAVESMSELNLGELAKGLTGLTIILAEVVAVTRFIGDPKHMISTGIGMIALGASMLIFAEAVEKMGQLSWEEIGKGLITMAGALTAITIATNFLPKGMINKATGMVVMGAALLIIGEAVGKMGSLSWDEIARGITTMAGALTVITAALNFLPKGMINKATGMVVMGAALLIIGEAVGKMGSLSWDEIARGITTMAGALAAITLALNFMPKNMVGIGVGLVVVGAALLIISEALENMGGMSWDETAKGLAALGGSLLIITFAMKAMTGGLPGAAAMLVMAGAIGVLTSALVKLGQMDLDEIGKGLLALVGVFVVVGAAGLLLAPLTSAILQLAAAIALLGVGVLAVGAGLLMFSAGLMSLAAAGTAGAAALVVVVTSLINLIPMVHQKIAEGIVEFARIITKNLPVIMEAVKQIAIALILVLEEITPPLVKAILTLIVTLLEQLADAVPKMVDAGMRLILGILEGIAAHIKDVVVVALKVVSEFLQGIAEGIPEVAKSAVDVVVAFIEAIGKETPRIIDAGFKMVIDFINGIADAIRENTPEVIESMGNLADAIIDGLIEGLTAGISKATKPIEELGGAIIGKFSNVLGIHSPSKEFIYLGQQIGEGLTIGIDNSITKATNSSSRLAKEIIENSKKSIEEFQAWVDEKKYYNEISLKEELDAWTLVQQRYKEGTEERKKADKEVYRLQKELVKATFQYSVDWIEREKYYNRLSLKEELEAWQRVQSRYMEGSEERKKADREVYRVQKELTEKKIELEKEYADTVKSINEDLKRDIQSLNDEYENALKSRTDEIYRSYRLFDKVSAPEYVSSDELIENLNTQVDSLKTWKDTLDNLTRRGLDPKLIEELREMGPSALGELIAISRMTDEQLSEYSDLWREKYRLAKKQATSELEEMRIENNKQIEQLKIEANAKLAKYIETWKTRMAELTDEVVLPTNTNIVISTDNTMNRSIEAINSKQAEYDLAGQNVASSLIAGIKSKDTATAGAFMQSVDICLTEIKNRYNDFYDIGKYLVQGFADGITKNTYLAEARSRAMASAAARAAEKELDIRSPSKVGYGIGNYFGLGFVNALSSYVSKSYQAGSEIAKSAKNGLSEAISKITDVIEGDIDTQPTIRPVLDLSDVEKGTGRLNALFSRTQAMSISTSMMSHTGGKVSETSEKIQNGGNVYTFVQNNYSPKALSRLEIYRQTKNQFSLLKGLVEA